MTVHSRAALTLATVRALQAAARSLGKPFNLLVTVVDDGSTDDTAARLTTEFPDFVTVIPGDGNLYWSKGMALAQASLHGKVWDYILWVNDDIKLESDAIARLLASRNEADIVIGSMHDGQGRMTYGGLRQPGLRPGNLLVVEPTAQPEPADTFQGNLVLVSRKTADYLGGPDSIWTHGYGDIDYGYRARSAGLRAAVAPGYFGICKRNSPIGTWQDALMSRRARLASLFGRKGLPIRDQLRFSLRHGGKLGLVWFAASYTKKLWLIARRRPLSEF